MVSAKPKLSLTVALGRADFPGGYVMFMLCGPDLFTLVAALIIYLAPVIGVGIAAALVIIKINAQRREHTAALPLDINHRSR